METLEQVGLGEKQTRSLHDFTGEFPTRFGPRDLPAKIGIVLYKISVIRPTWPIVNNLLHNCNDTHRSIIGNDRLEIRPLYGRRAFDRFANKSIESASAVEWPDLEAVVADDGSMGIITVMKQIVHYRPRGPNDRNLVENDAYFGRQVARA